MTLTEHLRKLDRARGLGLVELMVALAVVGVLLAVAIPAMSDFMERRRVIAVTGELSSLIAYAKAETNAIGSGVAVHMESDPNGRMSCVAVTTLTMADDCKCYNSPASMCPTSGSKVLRVFQLPRSDGVSFTASATRWAGLDQTLSFNRDTHFQSEKDVKLTVTGARTGVQLRIDINEAGRAKICSPSGQVGGYAACS